MRRTYMGLLAAAVVLVALGATAKAGEWKVVDDTRWCRNHDWDEDFCEVREITLPADREVIVVDGRSNGGIAVEGWDRNEIRLRVKINVWADGDDDEALEMARRIEVNTDGRVIRADGPRSRRHNGWSVSYRLMVPHESNLDLETNNGGISVEDVSGEIRLEATNGGLYLARLAGDVSGRTTNGGLDVVLEGRKWDGDGLDVLSTNGGISVEIPEDYSAELETGTVNGGISFDFPMTVQGNLTREIRATLGDGGPRIRLRTTNGGVRLSRI